MDSLINLAVSILKWDDFYFSGISDRYEYNQPPAIYTLEKRRGFRFVIQKHNFLKPVQAYDWFAVRSKYTKLDIQNGNTKWWKRHLLIKTVLDFLKKAMVIENESKGNGIARQYYNIIGKEFGTKLLLGEDNIRKAYGSVLKRCYYFVSGEGRAKPAPLRGIYSDSRLKNMGGISSYAELLEQIRTPLIIRNRWSLPPELREIYLPPFALQNIFTKAPASRSASTCTRAPPTSGSPALCSGRARRAS